MKQSSYLFLLLLTCVVMQLACESTNKLNPEAVAESPSDETQGDENNTNSPQTFNILSLGDSYTIGESVCETCRFPAQLSDSLKTYFDPQFTFNSKIIAQTGWTTSALKNAINDENPNNENDLVTLLIGVNNQYQNLPFSLYETEFPELLNTSINLAKGNPDKVIVLSIPDYAYTLFGQSRINPSKISSDIDRYNAFARNYCYQNNISFISITDITREGLENPDLVADDNLHPSELAYSKFVERLLPIALQKLQ